MPKRKPPVHLQYGAPMKKALLAAQRKWNDRFGLPPSDEICKELECRVRHQYRCSPFMGSVYESFGAMGSRDKHLTGYRYIAAGYNKYGHQVRYCWSKHRNEAGFFLAWREVYHNRTQTILSTNKWSGRRQKKKAKELCERRANAWERKHHAKAEPPTQGDA